MPNSDFLEPTKADIEAMLDRERFEYQRVELGHGLATSGADRTSTARAIFPDSLEGRSVLDVGCCYGFFLYEAHNRGATRLVGTEKNPDRLRQANLIKKIRGSDIELVDDDFESVCARDKFDVVLLLNVIHHLTDPINAIRTLAAAANETFIIEYPTPADPKFQRSLLPPKMQKLFGKLVAKALTRLPVIGVSSLARYDQTYVLTDRAIRIIMLEHERLARDITFLDSPIGGRRIAICHI